MEPAYTLPLNETAKFQEIIDVTRGMGLILSIDTNSRSKLWNIYTNRDKTLEEFIITSNLLVMNAANDIHTFETVTEDAAGSI
jgi:acetylornithine/succinyldiaminopimelate/putrescine aminotransferase